MACKVLGNYIIWTKYKGHPVVMRLWTSMGSWRGFIIYIIANVSIKIGNLVVLYSTTEYVHLLREDEIYWGKVFSGMNRR